MHFLKIHFQSLGIYLQDDCNIEAFLHLFLSHLFSNIPKYSNIMSVITAQQFALLHGQIKTSGLGSAYSMSISET